MKGHRWGQVWSKINWQTLRLELQRKLSEQGKTPCEIRRELAAFDKAYPRREKTDPVVVVEGKKKDKG